MATNIKKSAKHGNFMIAQSENNSITIICDNTKEALRHIADEVGMAYEKDWNTQSLGSKLINFLNEVENS